MYLADQGPISILMASFRDYGQGRAPCRGGEREGEEESGEGEWGGVRGGRGKS